MSKERQRLIALLALAVVVRLCYLLVYQGQPEWNSPLVDGLFHLNWADSIAGGNLLGSEVYFRAPFYIYVLAFLRFLSPESLLLPRLLGSLLGVVSVYVTYLLVYRALAGKRSSDTPLAAPDTLGALAAPVALAAGAIQALYPSLIFFESELLVDFLFAFLLQLSVFTTVRALDNSGDSFVFRRWILPGALLGLACLTRPTALALTPIFAFLAWRSGATIRGAVLSVLAILLSATLVILPVTLRNLIVGDNLTLIASSGGINFYIANNPHFNPVSASMPEPLGPNWTLRDMTGLAEEYEGRQLTPPEVAASWSGRGWEWIGENPGEFLRRYLVKLYIIVANERYSNNSPLGAVFANNPVLRFSPLNFALLMFLTWGGIFSLRRLNRDSRKFMGVTVTMAVGYALIVCLFFVNERFRLPVILLLFPLAGLGAVAFWFSGRQFLAKLNQENRLALNWRTALLAVVCALFTFLPWGRPHDGSKSRALYLQANGHLFRGELNVAVSGFRRLLRVNPTYPRGALNLAIAFFLQGKADSAEYYFQRELSSRPNDPATLANLASLRLSEGNFLAADSLANLSLANRPYDIMAWRIKLRSLSELGERSEAEVTLADYESRFADDVRYWYERGVYYLEINQRTEARLSFQRAAQLAEKPAKAAESSSSSFRRDRREQKELRQTTAKVFYQLGYFAGIERSFALSGDYSSRALELDSTLYPAYVNLMLSLASRGKSDSAADVYRLAQERFAQDSSRSAELSNLKQALSF